VNLAVLLAAIAYVAHGARDPAARAQRTMQEAAQQLVDAFDAESRPRLQRSFDGPERRDWHYVPRARIGVALGEMTDEQRRLAHALLRSTLSSRGYLKATGVIELERVLHDLEAAEGKDASARDPGRYVFAVFGNPSADRPWGWRVEGHHLSLNFSAVTRELIAVTPAFFGANPAEVKRGPQAGWRLLAAEEDLGRELVRSLDPAQLKKALIATEAPADILMGPSRDALERFEGLPASELSASQQDLLWRLLKESVENLRPELANAEWQRIASQDRASIWFAWAGALEPSHGHYYRVHSPRFVFEYDNTQNDANHVHTVWRDLEHDFGGDLLRRHYEQDHSRR
jgi:hypothetical protein